MAVVINTKARKPGFYDPASVAITGGVIGPRVSISGPQITDYSPSNPLYIAHRGSAALYPEEAKLAYDNSLFADGEFALEGDVNTLSDGSLGLMHDTTVDRTTAGTGNVNTFSATTFQALTMDASVWLGSNYGDTLNPMMFQAFIDAYKGKALLIPEDKDQISMTALVRALINSGVSRNQVLIQSFGTASLSTPVNAGYQAIGLTAAGVPTAAAVVGTGAQWAAVGSGESLASYIAANLKTLVYTVNRRYLRDQYLAQGATGFFSDDPAYLRGTVAVRKTDAFSRQTWIPGMLGNSSDQGLTLPNRGLFSSPDCWGYTSTTATYYECLMGFLGPLDNPSQFSLTFNVIYDSANAGDTSRWASVYFSTDDRTYDNTSSTTSTGYQGLMRKNGTLAIFRQDSGLSPVALASVTGSTIADGAQVTFKWTRNGTSITLALMSGATVLNSVSAVDGTYQPANVHLGRNGLACRFRSLQVA